VHDAWIVLRRPRRVSPELERRLRDYGRALDSDDVPHFGDRVRVHLEREPAGVRPRRSAVKLGTAAALAGVAGVAAVPAARTAVLDMLGRRSVRVVHAAPLPQAPRRGPALGTVVSLAAARNAVAFRILRPRGNEPDRVFLGANGGRDAVPGAVVSLVYGRPERPRLLVQEFLGASLGPRPTKGVTRRAHVERVSVEGGPGLWFGSAHELSFVDADGVTRAAAGRVVGRALVWEANGVIVRIEGRFEKRSALELARTFH
jgi:hypothetical protein